MTVSEEGYVFWFALAVVDEYWVCQAAAMKEHRKWTYEPEQGLCALV
jgi:hypothetical protein